GRVLSHQRYADKRLGERLIGSMLPLHSGSFFGLPGLVAMMLASLAMPLFTITGWLLYLSRRARKKAARAARDGAAPSGSPASASLLIGYASQTGTAEKLAWQSAAGLQAAGVAVDVRPLASLNPAELSGRALFLVSTFGDGE